MQHCDLARLESLRAHSRAMPIDPMPRRILVIQLRYLGDVLLTTPALRALRRAYPSAQIDFLVDRGSRAVLIGNPDLDTIIERPSRATLREGMQLVLSVRRTRYDLVIDFQHKMRSALVALGSGAPRSVSWGHTARRMVYRPAVRRPAPQGYMASTKLDLLRAAGVIDAHTLESPRPFLAISAQAQDWAMAAWNSLGLPGDKAVVALNPGARRADRRWTGFGALARRIASARGVPLLVLWGPGERELAEQVVAAGAGNAVLAPATSIEQLGALLARCALLIGNDTSARHIAVAVATPTLTISIDTTPATWTFPGPGHRCLKASGDGSGEALLERVVAEFEGLMQEQSRAGGSPADAT
jgi:heptosyltransferase-3